MRSMLMLEGLGKTGLVLRMNDEGDGYYLSLDLVNGIAQIRAWGANPTPEFEHAFRYAPLQEAHFRGSDHGPWQIEVVAHGMYIEFSIDGHVVLSLVDDSFSDGGIGFYTESAAVCLKDLHVETLRRARQRKHRAKPVYTATRQGAGCGVGRPVTGDGRHGTGDPWLLVSDIDDTLTGRPGSARSPVPDPESCSQEPTGA